MTALNDLTATDAARQIAKGEITCEALVRACLDRIEARDADVAAWVVIDPEHALDQARMLDAGPVSGPLHGIPVGFKDIIDTGDFPTRYGSPIYEGYVPEADAACVAHTRAAGAVSPGQDRHDGICWDAIPDRPRIPSIRFTRRAVLQAARRRPSPTFRFLWRWVRRRGAR